jgi:hypothetical protein
MEAVKKTVKDFPYMVLAGNAFAIGSKVSKNVYEVDTITGILMRGEAKIGGGDTAKLLKGKYTPGVPLPGACPIVTDNHLGLHDAALVDWRSAYGTYAAATTIGAIIFAGDAEGFATWAKSKACRDEVAGVPDGRLFALIDGYLVSVSAQTNSASPTVDNGTGSTVWANGNYYVGEIKDGTANGQGTWTGASGNKYVGQWKDGKKHGEGTETQVNGGKYVGEYKDGEMHGEGTWTFADGNKYVGQLKDGEMHGEGTYTWADGKKYVGQWKDDEMHGRGKATKASGEVHHDGEWVNGEPKE